MLEKAKFACHDLIATLSYCIMCNLGLGSQCTVIGIAYIVGLMPQKWLKML